MHARRLLSRGYGLFLAYVWDVSSVSTSLNSVFIFCDFPKVFLLHGLSLEWDTNFFIDPRVEHLINFYGSCQAKKAKYSASGSSR